MARDQDETSNLPRHEDDPLGRRAGATAAADEILGDVDAPATDALVPETQGEEPLGADLGEEGQGDLAPEDRPADARTEAIHRLDNDEGQGAG